MTTKKLILTCLLLFGGVGMSFGQYFNRLHDIDSVYEWGWNILPRPDGTLFVNGWGIDQTIGQPQLFNLKMSSDGSIILDKRTLEVPSTAYGLGDPAQLRKIPTGYIAPVTVQRPRGSYVSSAGGIIKYDPNGDTVFVKTYTDTSIYFDLMYCSGIAADGNYLVGGSHATNIPSYYPGIIMKMDTSGDTLWTRTYQKVSTQSVKVRTMIPLEDGRIVVGASSTYTYVIGPEAFYHHTPWFMVLDTNGNILRDTVYGAKYGGGGFIYKDLNGGYIHFGWIDTVVVPAFADDLQNFPYYIAHLDTNFRIEWLTRFPFSDCNSRRSPWQIKQLHDSTYLILGDDYCNGCLCGAPAYSGWAAKISKTGDIIWNRDYWTDTDKVAFLRDVVELPDHNLVFVGSAFNDTLPSWHAGRDVWIFGTDSNGCIIPMCGALAAPDVQPETERAFALYPNPTSGSLTLHTTGSGVFIITSIDGRKIMERNVKDGATNIELPPGIANGLYIGVYTPDDGTKPNVVRFVYQR